MKKGFTLVELLVVMVVVAVLVTIALPKYKGSMEKSRALEGIHVVKTISDSLNAFYIMNGNSYTGIESRAVETAGIQANDCTKGDYMICTRFFGCNIEGDGQSQTVTCVRNLNNPYNIIFKNEAGDITSRECTGNQKICQSLGKL